MGPKRKSGTATSGRTSYRAASPSSETESPEGSPSRQLFEESLAGSSRQSNQRFNQLRAEHATRVKFVHQQIENVLKKRDHDAKAAKKEKLQQLHQLLTRKQLLETQMYASVERLRALQDMMRQPLSAALQGRMKDIERAEAQVNAV